MAHKTGAAYSGGHIVHGCANAMYLPKVIRYNAKEAAEDYGLNIVAAFDTKGSETDDDMSVKILPIEALSDLCRRLQIRIGITTVPGGYAQEACDILVQSGVLAIWNFAPTHLHVPGNILVKNENMAASLAILSQHLSKKLLEDQ